MFEIDEIQAQAILDMRLQKLTGLERDKLVEDYNKLLEKISGLKSILDSEEEKSRIKKIENMLDPNKDNLSKISNQDEILTKENNKLKKGLASIFKERTERLRKLNG